MMLPASPRRESLGRFQKAAGLTYFHVAPIDSSSFVHCRLEFQSAAAVRVSRAAGAGSTGRRLTKYRPLIRATSPSAAKYTIVSAPFSADKSVPLIPHTMMCLSQLSNPLLRAKPVATAPGCKALEVALVDASRRASSNANRMLASLDFAYAWRRSYPCIGASQILSVLAEA